MLGSRGWDTFQFPRELGSVSGAARLRDPFAMDFGQHGGRPSLGIYGAYGRFVRTMSQTRANDGRCLLARRSLFRDTQRCANTSLMIIQEIRILCPFKSDSPALAIAAREDRRCCRMFNVGVNGIHRTRV